MHDVDRIFFLFFFFFFNDTATTEIYTTVHTLSLHDALPICTFGDLTDVIWWRELSLPVRAIVQPNGTLRPLTWGEPGWESGDAAGAQMAYDQLANLSVAKARARIVELLRESGEMLGEPRPITHPVKFFEKGDRPLEIVTSRQWFIKTVAHREPLLARGRAMQWHPEYMRHRF